MLPFSYTVRKSSNAVASGLDFSHQYGPDNCQVFVRIDDELWEFRTQWIIGIAKSARYKGPDIDHMVRVEDGGYPEGMTACWFLGGMWYDSSAGKLYAPMHVEQDGHRRGYPGWGCRKIALATSTDKGGTWKYEGDIVSSETYYYNYDSFKFSGSGYGNGVSDFGFYIDNRGGFIYIFPDEGWALKGTMNMRWNVKAARCAISDKMAPGKWRYFYNGSWDEPALGGKSSWVAPSHLWGVSYSTKLQKYIGVLTGNQDPPNEKNVDGVYFGACTDLGKQDWVWGHAAEPLFGFFNLFKTDGTDIANTCDDSFLHYAYWNGNVQERLEVTVAPGRTVTSDLRSRYLFEPHPESSDPMQSRVTKIVGATNPEMKYAGAWAERSDPDSYQGKSKESSTANSSVEFSFSGESIYWRALRSPACGRADVYMDGALRKTVDCYSPRSTSYEEFLYVKTGLAANSRHTIRIVVTGKKNPKSAGAGIRHIAFEYGAESYKASAGFSGLMGKNNWNYQELDGSQYKDLRFRADILRPEFWWFSDTGGRIGLDYQVPSDKAVVRRWIAPHAGTVRVEGGALRTGMDSESLVPSIVLKSEQVWPPKNAADGNAAEGNAATHDLQLTVAQGDALAFVVSRKPGSSKERCDSTRMVWDPVITYTRSSPAVWQGNPPGKQNLAEGKYARSRFLVSSYRPFDAVNGDLNTAFIIQADDKISSGDDWLYVDLQKTYQIDRYSVASQTQNPGYRPAGLHCRRVRMVLFGAMWIR